MLHLRPVSATLLLLLSPALGTHGAGLDPMVQTYLERYCMECHDADVQKGEFRVDNLSHKIGLEDTPQWLELMERINAGEMPPKKAEAQPSAAESAEAVEWIAARMKEGESARLAARGKVTYNRLTREEYVNSIYDLLGVHYDAEDPGAFLEDPEWHGFERLGAVLTLSPSNIEKYLAAAEVILDEAFPEKEPKPYAGTKRAIEEKQISERHRERLRAEGLLEKVRFECWPGDVFRYSVLSEPLPETGVYEITYTLSGLQPPGGRAPRMKVYESKLDRVLHEQDIVAPEDKPVTITFQAHLPKGRASIEVYNDVPGPSNLPRSGRHGERPFISLKDGRMPWQIKLTDEAGNARYPFLIIDSVSWRGPIVRDEEAARRARFWPKSESKEEVQAALTRFAEAAYRRPVSAEEMSGFVDIVNQELEAKAGFRSAVKAGMAAILCSKGFLFLTEGQPDRQRDQLTSHEIAARLSYLLWSTAPDTALLALAAQDKLRDKTELARQVQRMLTDTRAQRFTDAFSTQWLRLRKVGMFAPDKNLYPDYDAHLEQSMVRETREFFRTVLHSGLSLREFLHSDWTMLNARLAAYYELDATGLSDDFTRVRLPADSQRGGLLTQASILSLTSDGTRHRPVHRGVWVMESILGRSPPPPPANVDPIETNPAAPKATLREKLEAHVHDANCAGCHAKIDPLGLAFENYDAIGRWRTEEVTDGTGANPKVNAAGQLPDGRAYANAAEFKALLLADADQFAATFVEKLATYALRRSMSFDDKDELAAITTAARAKDYRVKDVIEALVCSDLFLKR